MTRDDYIEAMERLEFQSVQDTAKVWKSAAKGCGQDPSKCPSYGNPDNVLKLDFKTYFSRLSQSHKEGYGKQWDAANRGGGTILAVRTLLALFVAWGSIVEVTGAYSFTNNLASNLRDSSRRVDAINTRSGER